MRKWERLKICDRSLKPVIAFFSLISALELLAYSIGGFFSVLAAYIWLFTGFFWLGYFVNFSVMRLVKDLKERKFFISGAFLLLVAFLLLFIGNLSFSDINPDACQQVSSGLDAFKKADLGYTETAFLGYPLRQYIIAALPALCFGRSVWALHFGFGGLFLIGLTVLFFSLRKWLKMQGLKEEYALLPCFSIPVFPFIAEYYMNFEQAITPVALTMLGIGLFMIFLTDKDILSLLSLFYAGCLMADSYTPVLASLGLLMVFLSLYAWNVRREKPVLYSVIGTVLSLLVFYIATYMFGNTGKLMEFRETESGVKAAFKVIKAFFTDENVRFLGLFGGAVALYILLSFTGRLKVRDALVSCWVIMVVFFSDRLTGYGAYEKEWVMQRNMVVIPVLVVCIFLAVMQFIKKHGFTINKTVLTILLAFFFTAGILNFFNTHRSFRYFAYVQPMKYVLDYACDTIHEYGIGQEDEFNLIIYTDNGLQGNISDYAGYFFPNATTYSMTDLDTDDSLDISKPCFFFAEDTRLNLLYTDEDGRQFSDYMKAPVASRTYSDVRYGLDVTWYRRVTGSG